jgi:hypothetical protein
MFLNFRGLRFPWLGDLEVKNIIEDQTLKKYLTTLDGEVTS